MTDSKTREAFEAWFEGFEFDRAEYPARFSAWQAARRAALEEAVLVCEGIGDEYGEREGGRYPELKSDAQTGARDCESAIRALADETQEAGPSTGAPPRRYKPNEDCS